MKNIYFGLLATLLFCNLTSAQLMSDEEHRIMMNDYGNMVNYILRNQAGANADLNLIKRQIVNGEFWLSEQTKTSIIIYADSLKIYGSQFAAAKGLVANTDALKYFYSTFAPSTVVQNGKFVESSTAAGLTATEMWTCALDTFGTSNCGSSVLVSDKSNLSTLATTSVNKLTSVSGNIGILVMLNGCSDCMSVISVANDVMTISSFLYKNQALIDTNFEALSQASEAELIPLMQSFGFQDVQLFADRLPKAAMNIQTINEIAHYEMDTYHIATIESTPIYGGLKHQLGDYSFFTRFLGIRNSKCKDSELYDVAPGGNQCTPDGNIKIKGRAEILGISIPISIVNIKSGSIFI